MLTGSCFSQLGLINDPHIIFQISRNGLNDHKGQENITGIPPHDIIINCSKDKAKMKQAGEAEKFPDDLFYLWESRKCDK